MRNIIAQLNLFKLFEWDPDFSQVMNLPENPTYERLLEYLCSIDMESDMSAFKSRYVQVSETDRDLIINFIEAEIDENLVSPLRQAKTNYILGNYVGTIVLCGIVAEKVALFTYKKNTTDEAECEKFDDLYQPERVKRLKKLGYIDEQSEKDFKFLIGVRRSYLHHWNIPEARTAERAVQSYAAAVRLIFAVIHISFDDGTVFMDDRTFEYLEKRGVFQESGDGR